MRHADSVMKMRAGSTTSSAHAAPEAPGIDVLSRELAQTPLLAELPSDALRALADGARRRRWAPGDVVFHEGDAGDSLHVVRLGLLAVVRPSRDPGLVLNRMRAGDAFGEIAVLTEGPRLASVVSIEPSETLEVTKDDFDAVLAANPPATRRMLGALARSLTLAKEDVTRQNSRLEATVRERTADLRESQLEVVRRLSHAAESRDDQTGVHITRMSRMCAELGRTAGLEESDVELLLHAASMHDIGKIAIPDRVLLKPGPLEPDEWELMKSHTVVGAEMLADSRSPVVQMGEIIARSHHEKWDGTGYPLGLRGEEIPLVARICAVCDVYDALVSDRPYKSAWTVDSALDELRRLAGHHMDPRLVGLFVQRRPDLRAGG
jgi:HD-GYP domain-containing protein (c-di-GMP phosphodiesterase class II)